MPRKKKEAGEQSKGQHGMADGYVPARWERIEQFPVIFANQIFVHLEDGQYVITFGHGKLPFEAPYTAETFKRLQKTGVPIIPVARILVGAERLGVMLQVLGDFYKTQTTTLDKSSVRVSTSG